MTIQVVPNDNTWLAPTNNPSAALEASRIAKASAGVLYGISGYNSGGAQFLQLHDSATLPADTAVPAVVYPIAATSAFSFDFGMHGMACNVGIVVCNSSTAPTKTIGAANCWFAPRFK